MLPPQLRRSRPTLLTSPSVVSHVSTTTQMKSRSIWSGKSAHWTSQLDPLYRRLNRFHTLKCHAKFLDALKRRGKFEGRAEQWPTVNSKHLRYASHYNSKPGGSKWRKEGPGEQKGKSEDEKGQEDGSRAAKETKGFELSQREKRWKELMDVMRKKIERDPYEAVFGKRFEPFWSPLVPSWMREEMGLQGWPKRPQTPPMPNSHESTKTDEFNKLNESKAEKPIGHNKPDSYSYASATTFDSRSNKTKRTEWDSTTGETKRFEYDPISNRMIQVDTSKSSKGSTSPANLSSGDMHTSGLAKKNLDSLKATDVRAAMGKVSTRANSETDVKYKSTTESHQVAKEEEDSETYWDKRLAKSGRRPYVFNKQLDLVREADEVHNLVEKELRRFEMHGKRLPFTTEADKDCSAVDKDLQRFELHRKLVSSLTEPSSTDLQPALDRIRSKLAILHKAEDLDDSAAHEATEPAKSTEKDLDDSAAHEATEPINPVSEIPNKTSACSLNSSNESYQQGHDKHAPETTKAMKPDEDLDDSAAHEATEPVSTSSESAPEKSRGEGDFCANVVKFADSDMWFKRPATIQPNNEQTPVNPEIDVQDESLVKEIQRIYESRYGLIGIDHEKLTSAFDTLGRRKAVKKINVVEVESDVDLGEALAKHEKDQESYQFLQDDLDFTIPQKKPTSVDEALSRHEADKTQGSYRFLQDDIDFTNRQKPTSVDEALARHEIENFQETYKFIQDEFDQFDLISQQKPTSLEAALTRHEVEKDKQSYRFLQDDLDFTAQQKPTSVDEALTRHETYLSTRPTPAHATQPTEPSHNEVDQALAVYETGQDLYQFQSDNLAQEIAEGDILARQSSEEARKKQEASLPMDQPAEAQQPPPANFCNWCNPPLYKVLAYDSGNDKFSTATTTSNFSPSESPISIPEALSKLYQPARFVPYFAELQSDGYQVIYGTRDLLVFKKVKDAQNTGELTVEQPSLVDHGLAGMEKNNITQKRSTKSRPFSPQQESSSYIPVHIGALTPVENAAAQEAAHYYDAMNMTVNPVDGTSKPATGNFASPTGFVNHDPITPLGGKLDEVELPKTIGDSDHSFPRVRRQELVFSGATPGRRQQLRAERSARREEKRQRRRRGAGAIKWALSVGLGTAVVTYTIGVAAEAARQDKRKE